MLLKKSIKEQFQIKCIHLLEEMLPIYSGFILNYPTEIYYS